MTLQTSMNFWGHMRSARGKRRQAGSNPSRGRRPGEGGHCDIHAPILLPIHPSSTELPPASSSRRFARNETVPGSTGHRSALLLKWDTVRWQGRHCLLHLLRCYPNSLLGINVCSHTEVLESGPVLQGLGLSQPGTFVALDYFCVSLSHQTMGTGTFMLNKHGKCRKLIG